MPHILLADDHFIIREGMKLIIQHFIADTIIDEAEDGNIAYEKIKKNKYDLLILDVNMPNTDSLGLINNIILLRPDAKILMFSMNSEEIYAKRYLKMGAMGYVRKDAHEDEIKKAIITVLSNKRYMSSEMSERLLDDLYAKDHDTNPFDKLSPREFEIIQHLIRGDSLSKICSNLSLQLSTVGTYKARIFEKLSCKNVIDLNELAKIHNVIFTG